MKNTNNLHIYLKINKKTYKSSVFYAIYILFIRDRKDRFMSKKKVQTAFLSNKANKYRSLSGLHHNLSITLYVTICTTFSISECEEIFFVLPGKEKVE